MTSKDVRDIMQLGPAPTSTPGLSTKGGGRSNGPPNPLQHQHKRPDGITRELYALIGDNAPSLQMIQPVKPKFKERIFNNKKAGTGDSMKNTSGKKKNGDKQVKWQLIGFTNPSRSQEKEKEKKKKLVLKHWVKDVPKNYIDGTPDTKFSKFNTTSQPFTYTEREYQDYLKSLSDKWTKEETDHLFDLVKEFDSRFIVVQDRWELTPLRSVDELKDRYYSICRTLAEKRPDPPIDPTTTDPTSASALEMKEKLDKQRQETISSFSFDYSREIERKNYLKSLLERTRQQINEEDFLYVESRRIEQNYYKMNQERKELLKLLGQRDGIGIDYNNLASHQLLGIQPNGITTSATSIRNSTGAGGGGLQQGGVQANGAATLAGVNKRKMHGWEFEGNGNGLPEGWAGEGSKRKATAAQDAANCIERHPAPSVSAPKSNMWPSVALRSSRILPVKSNVAQKVSIALSELGLSTQLIMPTKNNIEKLDEVQGMLSSMVEVKKGVDRIQQELRTWKKKKEILLGIHQPQQGSQRGTPMVEDGSPSIKLEDEDRQRNKRSASVASSTVSTKRARRE